MASFRDFSLNHATLYCRPRQPDSSRYRPTSRPQVTTPGRPRPRMGYIAVRIDLQRSRFPLNDQINIPCTVNSYSKPNVFWSKNGQRIRSSQRLQVCTINFTHNSTYGLPLQPGTVVNDYIDFWLIKALKSLTSCFIIELQLCRLYFDLLYLRPS